jgi:hypothetical protein
MFYNWVHIIKSSKTYLIEVWYDIVERQMVVKFISWIKKSEEWLKSKETKIKIESKK